MNTDYCSELLISIRMPGLEPEPSDPFYYVSRVAGSVLNDLLSTELSASNLVTELPQVGPRLFAGKFLFNVTDVRAAAAIVLAILQRNGIDLWATLFRFDSEEHLWLSLYPRTGIGLRNDHLVAELETEIRNAREADRLWTAAIKRLSPSTPQGETGDAK